MENGPLDQTASLMLVNSWYKTSSSSTTTAKTPLLRLRKTTSLQRKNNLAPEKAVGKIYIQCLYVKTRGNYMPRKMEEAIEALNANRFHQTDWQAGYMSQIGGNIKVNASQKVKL
jgi:hypothetical protein